ncbi:MAG: GTPase Era [Desulfomonile tiedjei]|nr:GTPase Era [Desulfomonile tiedjei]
MTTPDQSNAFRSGFIAVAGRPNVGKSTLVNRIMGQEVAIVTPKAQTTRHRITAIHTLPNVQMVFQDTPGFHDAKTPLNKSLVATAVKSLEEADVILLMVEPGEKIHDDDLRIIDLIKSARPPSVVAINKIDTVEPPTLLPLIDAFSKAHTFAAIVPISALNGSGVDDLVETLIALLPEGQPLFPEDEISDLPVRFFVSEIVREQIMKLTGEEIPYKTAVVVESFKEKEDLVVIHAEIHVERDSQKAILIGKNGTMIKRIGINARKKIEEFLERRVHLELFVKVSPRWTRDPYKLKEFGY